MDLLTSLLENAFTMYSQRLFRSFIFLCLMPSLAISQPSDALTITLHRSFLKPPKVRLTSVDMVSSEPMPVGRIVGQQTNQVALEVVITRPQFAFLEVDGTYIPLYLEPKYDLQLYMGSADSVSIRFEGSGAIPNDYLAKANAIRRGAELSAGTHYMQLSLTEFMAHLKAVRGQYEQLDQTVLAKANLADSLKDLLSDRNQVGLTFIQQNYVIAQYGEKLAQVPDLLTASIQPPVFNARFVWFKLPEYADVANVYVSFILRNLLSAPGATSESAAASVDQFIQQSTYSPMAKAYFRATNCYHSLRFEGITPTTDSLLARYKISFPQSTYFPTLANLYQKWSSLASGQPAPDFYGVTPGGDTLSLRSLKGKVVYVDVWATWCVPCRAEFPQAKQVQQQFLTTPGVVFLFVSVDQNQTAWKKLLQADPHLRGIHINQASSEQPGSLWKPYLMRGIPRYILIDQQGRIIQANADQPSSGKVVAAIQKLLR
jgi:thiol-disulfide isomerase/thioredoxin